MKRMDVLVRVGALLVTLVFGCVPCASAQVGDETESSLRFFRATTELGIRLRDINGERASKFQEFRDVPQGVYLRAFRILGDREGSPYQFDLQGTALAQRDQFFKVTLQHYEKFKTELTWGQLPRFYATGTASMAIPNAGNQLVIPGAVRTALQNATDTELPGLVRSFLGGVARSDIRTLRTSTGFSQLYSPTEHWNLRATVQRVRRTGSRPIGTGTYERVGTAQGDTFRVLGVELPEPVNYRDTILRVGTGYHRERWIVGFTYTHSRFENRVDALRWDNPFRIADQQAISGGNFERHRFATGQLDLYPDNSANSLHIAGAVDLPFRTRLAGAVDRAYWRQNDAFLPFTLNSAVVAGNLPAGTSVSSLEALPARSLNGRVDTLTQDYVTTTRLTKQLVLINRYRYYDYSNKTASIHFPGYAAYAESYWRTNIANEPIENLPNSFIKQKAGAELNWKVHKTLTWKGEGRWEGWNRVHRQVVRTNEYIFKSSVSYKPTRWFSMIPTYHYGSRIPRAYDPGVKEFSLLRMVDQARRLRNDAGIAFDIRASAKLALQAAYRYSNDNFDRTYLGVTRYLQGTASVDVTYTPADSTTFYVNYSHDRFNAHLQQISKTAVPFDLNNRWNRDSNDKADSFGVGITTVTLKDKVTLDLSYASTLARTLITTANPVTPLANSLFNATAFAFPKLKNQFHEVRADASYQLRSNLALGLRYLYEPYRLSDFSWDPLSPYPLDELAPENSGPRFLLLDSRYTNYSANLISVYLRVTY
jgi:MtrB/PioB family decaheme-associated outer membrane protein